MSIPLKSLIGASLLGLVALTPAAFANTHVSFNVGYQEGGYGHHHHRCWNCEPHHGHRHWHHDPYQPWPHYPCWHRTWHPGFYDSWGHWHRGYWVRWWG